MRSLVAFFRRRTRDDADFAAEIDAHLSHEIERLVASGMPAAAAAQEARRRFGNVTQAQEAFHRRRALGWIGEFPLRLRRAARRLGAAPLFSATVILTLAIGIGATTAVFGLVDAVLLRPLPYARPERLVAISHTLSVQGIARVDQSDATYLYYRRANHTLSGVGVYRVVPVNLGLPADAGAERAQAARASASLFTVLGATPLLGRLFRDAEDLPGGPPVVVLGQRLWQRDFGADPGIIGRTVKVDGVPCTVIGVLPASFVFPDDRTALWLPVGIDPSRTESATFDYQVVARLRDGVSVADAGADLQSLLPRVPEAFPGRLTADAIRITRMQAVVQPLRDVLVGSVGAALWVVLGAALFLLLTACANIANLFLARGEERQHELAVRQALGAGTWELAAEFLAEGLLLALIGGGLGLAAAAMCLGILRSVGPGVALPLIGSAGIDGTVIAVAAGVTLASAVVMSVVPALRRDLGAAAVLAQTGRATTAGRQRHRTRRLLVVVQVALGFLLVAGAALMTRSFGALRAVPPGFEPSGAYVFRMALPAGQYPTTADGVGLVDRMLDRISALPGVSSAGAISKIPLAEAGRLDTAVWIEDRPLAMNALPNVHQVVYATPGAFAALGIPLVSGRTFSRPDPARAELEVIVTRALAARYWGAADPVGRRLRLSAPSGPWFTVVGVTGDVHGTRLDAPPDETVFLPLVTAPGVAAADGGAGPVRWMPRTLAVVVRGPGDAAGLAAPLARTVRTLAPGAPLYDAEPLSKVADRSLARTTFTLLLLRVSSLAALLIAAVGIYGVVWYMVRLRLKEMAVRLALGAAPRALRRLVLGQAAGVIAAGLGVGTGAALLVTRALRGLLFRVSPVDPLSFGAALAVMAAAGVIASWLPAARAAAADPAAILRTDT